MNTSSRVESPFTQSWIQALMPSAAHPATKTIKPKLEWIDHLSLSRHSEDREPSARSLWEYGNENGLGDLLKLLPVSGTEWTAPQDERFIFRRAGELQIDGLENWLSHLGLQPATYSLQAEVTSSDWTTLVRDEAVRLQKPFSASAFDGKQVQHPPCTATWETAEWKLKFDEIDWLELSFDEAFQVKRQNAFGLHELVLFALSEAERSIGPKGKTSREMGLAQAAWTSCEPRLADLHADILDNEDVAPWTQRIWAAVWPIVYREQNLLRGQADLEQVRRDFSSCIENASKMTVWMFVLAKLTCQCQCGLGLGMSADFVDG